MGIPKQGSGSLAFHGPAAVGTTVFAHFPLDTPYFGEGPQQVMINFRIDDLDALLTQLAAPGVCFDPHREDCGYGRFAWIWDQEGNRVELWQPLPI